MHAATATASVPTPNHSQEPYFILPKAASYLSFLLEKLPRCIIACNPPAGSGKRQQDLIMNEQNQI